MSSPVNWTITPDEVLTQLGWQHKLRRGWYVIPICPFCRGGTNRDRETFIVHAKDGNYACLRASCDEKGSFWKLLEFIGENPKEYIGADITRQTSKRRYVYGK